MSLPPPGTPIASACLARSDRLLLWAIRAWVIGFKRRWDVIEPLRAAFDRFGIADAAELLDAVMSVVACGATRCLAVECVCAAHVTADESRLLAAVALHQANRGFEARFLLREILTRAASRDAGELLDRMGAVLSTAAHTLTIWNTDTGRYLFRAETDGDDLPVRPLLH
jgi:hypothetical protein